MRRRVFRVKWSDQGTLLIVISSLFISVPKIRSRVCPAWWVGPETNCENPSVSMEDISSIHCFEVGSSAWMLKSPRMIVLGYCSFQDVAASRSPNRASTGALGER